jgi:hypothetical protein
LIGGFVKIQFFVDIMDSNSGRWVGGFVTGTKAFVFVNMMEVILMYILILNILNIRFTAHLL